MGSKRHSLAVRLPSLTTRRIINTGLFILLVICLWKLRDANQEQSASNTSGGLQDAGNPRAAAQEKASILAQKYRPTVHDRPELSAARLVELYGDKENKSKSKYSTTIVLGRRDNETERVAWLEDLRDITKKEVYVVDNSTTDLPHLEKNFGREAAVYLNYIITNYENLNDITFFWHTDKTVWHNNLLMQWDSVASINRMDRENIIRRGYVPSRCDHWPGCPSWIRFNPSRAEHSLDPHRLEDMFSPQFFNQIFPEVKIDEIPPYFAGTCCSQFAVSRETIRSRSIETYKRLLHWITEYQSDTLSGTVLEYLWPFIFTGTGSICPSIQDCYCNTYNLCIDDQKELEQITVWNSMRTRREEIKWQVTFMETALETKEKEMKEQGVPSDKIVEEIQALEPELQRLKTDYERYEQLAWQKREDIIHHWQLPAPPVGW